MKLFLLALIACTVETSPPAFTLIVEGSCTVAIAQTEPTPVPCGGENGALSDCASRGVEVVCFGGSGADLFYCDEWPITLLITDNSMEFAAAEVSDDNLGVWVTEDNGASSTFEVCQ